MEVKLLPRHISTEKEKEIVEYYKSKPMTFNELVSKFGLCSPTIGKILNKYHIARYTKSQLYSPELVEDYFSVINTQAKAYFLGLIITDGCIYSKNGKAPRISISLHDNDSYLIKLFLKEIHSNKKVTNDGRGCSEVAIGSHKMVSDLRKYGLLERKSLCTVFPSNLPIDYYPSLLRGIIDGDGSISFYARKGRKCHTKAIRLCSGNEKFLLDIVEFLHRVVGIDSVNVYRDKENLWSIAYRKTASLLKLIEYLYSDAEIYMKRKKELCDLVYAECVQYTDGNTEITK